MSAEDEEEVSKSIQRDVCVAMRAVRPQVVCAGRGEPDAFSPVRRFLTPERGG